MQRAFFRHLNVPLKNKSVWIVPPWSQLLQSNNTFAWLPFMATLIIADIKGFWKAEVLVKWTMELCVSWMITGLEGVGGGQCWVAVTLALRMKEWRMELRMWGITEALHPSSHMLGEHDRDRGGGDQISHTPAFSFSCSLLTLSFLLIHSLRHRQTHKHMSELWAYNVYNSVLNDVHTVKIKIHR